MLVIGRNPVIEALRYNPEAVKEIVIQEGVGDKKAAEIVRTAKKKRITVTTRSKTEFAKLFNEKNKSEGISQGIAALADEFRYSNLEEILHSLKNREFATLVVLDEIQDPHNLGAIIRTSAAAEADAVIVSRKNSAKVTHTVIKSSSGAVNNIPIIQAENAYTCLLRLKKEGFTIVGSSLKSPNLLNDYRFPSRIAIVLGSEGTGIRKNIVKLCDDVVRIPVAGGVQSLNVSVAAGVILYEIRRVRNQRKID